MEELLKKLIESELLDSDTVDSIKEALAAKEQEIEDRVRKEFSESYKSDQDKLIVAVETMLDDRLRTELTEFAEDRANLRKMTAKATRAIREADSNAKKTLKKKIVTFESLLKDGLTKELEEFAEDRKIQRNSFLKQVKENKARSEKDRAAFVTRGAAVLESLMEGELRKLINEFREDIVEAKRNDFGRRVFEAMAAEYRSTFFNENNEAKKLAKDLKETKVALKKIRESYNSKVTSYKTKLTESENRARKLEESTRRSKTINSLISKLTSGKAKKDMKTILESVPTSKLESTFKRYLSEVAKAPAGSGRKPLSESRGPSRSSVLRNGNLSESKVVTDDADADLQSMITRLKRLA